MSKYIAQVPHDIGDPLQGLPGQLGEGAGEAPSVLASVLSGTLGLLTVVAVIWFLFTLITGALEMIGSEGDKAAYQKAQKKITTGVIGLVIVVMGTFIFDLAAELLNLPINILNIEDMVTLISPN